MNSPERIAQSWLRYANSWLNNFEKGALSDPARLLLDRLEEKRKRNESKFAWDIINDLRRLSDRSEEKESAEIRLRCGLVAAEMDNFRDALRLLSEASSKYTNFKHHRAVALWMVGCAQWLLPDKEIDAINSWQTSLGAFEVLRDHNKNKGDPHEWYKKRCEEMFTALHSATEQYTIPLLPENAGEWLEHPDTQSQPLQTQFSDKSVQDSPVTSTEGVLNGNADYGRNRLSIFPVYEHIAAGDFNSSGILSEPISRLEIEQVLIDDRLHRICSLLRGERILNLPNGQGFFILKVNGTSMNQAKPFPIEDGDHVLVHKQNEAKPGDIVAAEIISSDAKDDRATLKRYKVQGDKILLIPESSDPKFQQPMYVDKMYSKLDEEFHIRGIALAVFKKL